METVQEKNMGHFDVSTALLLQRKKCEGLTFPLLSTHQGGRKSHSPGAGLHFFFFLQWNLGGSSSISVIPRKKRSHFVRQLIWTKRKHRWGHPLASLVLPFTLPLSAQSTACQFQWDNPISTLFLRGGSLQTHFSFTSWDFLGSLLSATCVL